MSFRTPQSSLKARAKAQQPGSASASKLSRSGSITNSVVERTVAYKESIEERQHLEKANFDLKMKVFHLEDALKKYTGEDSTNDGSGTNMGPSITYDDMKKQIKEKNDEIDQKNVLILKAKAAIEALKAETQKHKLDEDEMNNYTKSLEERCVKATENEIMITAEFKKQHLKLEAEFAQLRAENEEKTAALIEADAKIIFLQKKNDEFEAMRKGIEEERNEFYKEVLAIKEGDSSLQGQLAQAQAHNKLYEDQIHAITSENEELKREVAALIERKSGIEGDQARTITNLQQQLRDLRVEYEQSVLQLSEEHAKAINQTKMDFAHNWSVNDQLSRQNERNEWQEKYNHKHNELEMAMFKHDSVASQLDDLRRFSSEKDLHVENLTAKVTHFSEQHQQLTMIHENLTNDYQEIHGLHAKVKTDHHHLEKRHAELQDTHNDTKSRHSELQVLVGSLETENKHLLKDIEMYKRKIDSLEDLSRDNERLKYDHMVVSKKNVELENFLKEHVAHKDRLNADLDDHKLRIKGHLEKIRDHEETHKILHGHKLTSEQALQYERERASAAEEKIFGLQQVIDELKEEVVSHQDTIGSHTTKLNDHSTRASDLTNALSSMYNSIKDWEGVITIVLEGIDSGNNNNQYRNSPIHHDDDIEDPATSVAFLSLTSFDLVRKVSARTERMDGKIARLAKLRKTLDSQMGKLLSTYTEKLSHANDKCALLEYRATDLERKLDEARNRIDDHHGHLSTHTKRFDEFREKVSADHAARVKELSDNHSALQHIHELEKKKCYTASEELEKSKKEITELMELVNKYAAQEEKMGEVSETNRLLSFEVEDRGEKLKTLYEEHEELIREFQSLQEKESEESRILAKQTQQIDALEGEVRYLSSRQMDPTLQQTIMQTQGMLQYHIDSKSVNNNDSNNDDVSKYKPNWQDTYMNGRNDTTKGGGDIMMTTTTENIRDDPHRPLTTASLMSSSSSSLSNKYRFNPSPPNLKTNFNDISKNNDMNANNDMDGINGYSEPAGAMAAMSYSRGSFNPSPPNLKSHTSEFIQESDNNRGMSTSMMSTGMVMNSPVPISRGGGINEGGDIPQISSSTNRSGQFDMNSNKKFIHRPGADFSNSLPANRVQIPASSYSSYVEKSSSVELQDPTPTRRLDMKTIGGGVGGRVGKEEESRDIGNSFVSFPYRGSSVVVNSTNSSSSSIASSYATRGGTISAGGNPRGYNEGNPIAYNVVGSPSTDIVSNQRGGNVTAAGITPYKPSSSPSYSSGSGKRWGEYSNSVTPLQRQSLGRSGNNFDSLSSRLEDIEHRKSKLITKVMHH